jgi:hypothetical protein
MFRVRLAIIGFALVLVAYVAAYAGLLEPSNVGTGNGESYVVRRVHTYRTGGDAATTVFGPLAWADRRVRPNYWSKQVVPVSPPDVEAFRAAFCTADQ